MDKLERIQLLDRVKIITRCGQDKNITFGEIIKPPIGAHYSFSLKVDKGGVCPVYQEYYGEKKEYLSDMEKTMIKEDREKSDSYITDVVLKV